MTCTHALIIHKDGTCFCPGPGCVRGGVAQAVLRHRVVVSCQEVLPGSCPTCNAGYHRAGSEGARPTAPPAVALCPGTAVVHVDGSAQCCEPGCEPMPSLGQWLAGHSRVRSCRSLEGSCPLCSAGD